MVLYRRKIDLVIVNAFALCELCGRKSFALFSPLVHPLGLIVIAPSSPTSWVSPASSVLICRKRQFDVGPLLACNLPEALNGKRVHTKYVYVV